MATGNSADVAQAAALPPSPDIELTLSAQSTPDTSLDTSVDISTDAIIPPFSITPIPFNLGLVSPMTSSSRWEGVTTGPPALPPNMYCFLYELSDFQCDWQSLFFTNRFDLLPLGAAVFVRSAQRTNPCRGVLHVVVGTCKLTDNGNAKAAASAAAGAAAAAAHPPTSTTTTRTPEQSLVHTFEEEMDNSSSLSSPLLERLRPSNATLQRGLQNALSLAHHHISALTLPGGGAQVRVPLLGAGYYRTHWQYELKALAMQLLAGAMDVVLQLRSPIQLLFVLKEEGTAVVVREALTELLCEPRYARRREQIQSFVFILRGDILDPDLTVPGQQLLESTFIVSPCDCELQLCSGLAQSISNSEVPSGRQRLTLEAFRRDYWQTKRVEVARFQSAACMALTATPQPSLLQPARHSAKRARTEKEVHSTDESAAVCSEIR